MESHIPLQWRGYYSFWPSLSLRLCVSVFR